MNPGSHSLKLNARLWVWLPFLALLIGGCTSPRLDRELSDIPIGPRYQPNNLYAVSALPDNFRRVAVLPVHVPDAVEIEDQELDSIIQAEIRRTGRFEVVEVTPDRLYQLIGTHRLSSLNAVPDALLNFLTSSLGADGILQTDLTSYRPYRPFEVGLRMRLFDIRSGEPLWAVDEILNAGDKDVHRDSRHYSLGQVHNKYPFEDSYAALRSPSRFAAYSAFTLFETIPAYAVAPVNPTR